MTHRLTIRCHPEEDGLHSESQGVSSGLLIMDLNPYPDVYKAALSVVKSAISRIFHSEQSSPHHSTGKEYDFLVPPLFCCTTFC